MRIGKGEIGKGIVKQSINDGGHITTIGFYADDKMLELRESG